MLLCPFYGYKMVVGNPGAVFNFYFLIAVKEPRSYAFLVLKKLLDSPLGYNIATVDTGSRAKLHHIVGSPYSLLVVLHHNKGVAQVPQVPQGVYELFVIALVEPDCRLIQDIQHTHEGASDLGGKPYALGLAPRQGCSLTVQCKVAKPHRIQELEPCLYLLKNLARYLNLGLGKL